MTPIKNSSKAWSAGFCEVTENRRLGTGEVEVEVKAKVEVRTKREWALFHYALRRTFHASLRYSCEQLLLPFRKQEVLVGIQ